MPTSSLVLFSASTGRPSSRAVVSASRSSNASLTGTADRPGPKGLTATARSFGLPCNRIRRKRSMEKNKVILLVEDNPDDEALTLRALEKNNISNQIVVARDGVEAVDYLFGTGGHVGRPANLLPE